MICIPVQLLFNLHHHPQVVDLDSGEAVPAGVRGEVCIKGPQVDLTMIVMPNMVMKIALARLGQ